MSRRKEIKSRAEINDIKTKRKRKTKTNSWFFKKLNKIDTSLIRLKEKQKADPNK